MVEILVGIVILAGFFALLGWSASQSKTIDSAMTTEPLTREAKRKGTDAGQASKEQRQTEKRTENQVKSHLPEPPQSWHERRVVKKAEKQAQKQRREEETKLRLEQRAIRRAEAAAEGLRIAAKIEAEQKAEMRRIADIPKDLAETASKSFLVKGCPSCYENAMHLLSVSPNGRSIAYRCATCGKKQRAVAANPDAQKVVGLLKQFADYHIRDPYLFVRHGSTRGRQLLRMKARLGNWPDWPIEERIKWSETKIAFTVPQDPLPYEQTTRGTITEAMRSEIWRRDAGKCTTCGRNQNLQFDHIIPVAKGGATTVDNLQLLCQSCNLAKGAKI